MPQRRVTSDVRPERARTSVSVPLDHTSVQCSAPNVALHGAVVGMVPATAVTRHVLQPVRVGTRKGVDLPHHGVSQTPATAAIGKTGQALSQAGMAGQPLRRGRPAYRAQLAAITPIITTSSTPVSTFAVRLDPPFSVRRLSDGVHLRRVVRIIDTRLISRAYRVGTRVRALWPGTVTALTTRSAATTWSVRTR
jgi:hypothetical protein